MHFLKTALAALAATVAVGTTARPAYAWDELGHRVVARIAWDNMTPRAREAAVRLLMNGPHGAGLRELMPATGTMEERQRELFVLAAVWPDLIRGREHPGFRFAHSDWHYVNFFWEQRPDGSRVDRPDVPRAGELITQLQRIERELADASRADSARAVDLAWALHLVGDGHQPLHNSARITAARPEGDRGGNSFRLAGLYPFNNLHAYWDSMVGFTVPWRTGVSTEAEYVGDIAARLQRENPRARFARRLLPGQFEAWSREGVRVARDVAYPAWLVEGERAPRRYRPYAWRAAEPRLALAGYRLADLLNRTLGA
ncbi:MAG TPA: S1/P1 nuclease [Longimicrobium sp.]|nr:S1/P1 nuclease [Longimicrobium sp.]